VELRLVWPHFAASGPAGPASGHRVNIAFAALVAHAASVRFFASLLYSLTKFLASCPVLNSFAGDPNGFAGFTDFGERELAQPSHALGVYLTIDGWSGTRSKRPKLSP